MKNKKSLGQNWLKNRLILDEIADLAIPDEFYSAGSKVPTLCLEIGPGLGTLTSSLLKRFEKVMAVEYDQSLAANLPKSFPGTNLEVVCQDFLQFDFNNLPPDYVAVGNIPYYITSPIIQKLLSAPHLPARVVLLIQKEVAERIAAGPGKHTFLSLSVQNQATVALGPVVSRAEFTPPPKVDSQVIILTPHATPIIDPQILKLIKRGFSSPRKKLIKNLLPTEDTRQALIAIGKSPDLRPADLSLLEWQNLAKALAEFKHNQ